MNKELKEFISTRYEWKICNNVVKKLCVYMKEL